MAVPFLPPPLLSPTFNFIQIPLSEISEVIKLEKINISKNVG